MVFEKYNDARKAWIVRAPWRDLGGPSRSLAARATVLLVASALGGAEAAVLMVLGPARDIVIKPFVILGYLEACAIVFSLIGIAVSIVCIIFYRPYLLLSEKLFLYRARRGAPVSDPYTYFETVPRGPIHDPDEDGTPD